MNAPTDHAHLAPQLQLREVPAALIEKGIVPFIKIDKGLEAEENGVQLPTSAWYGMNTFGLRQMKSKLPKGVYNKLALGLVVAGALAYITGNVASNLFGRLLAAGVVDAARQRPCQCQQQGEEHRQLEPCNGAHEKSSGRSSTATR